MHVAPKKPDVEIRLVEWNPGDGPAPVAVIEPYPNLRFLVFLHQSRNGFVLRSDLGVESFIPMTSLYDKTPTMECLRSALQWRDMELFIPPVVIDDTDLFIPRIVI